MPKEKRPFVDFRDIRSRITMEQVLLQYQLLDTFTRVGPYLFGPCPIHKGRNQKQFRVDTEKNVWTCFSECEHGGNALDFVSRMERCSIHEAALKACEVFDIPLKEVIAGNEATDEITGEPPKPAGSDSAPVPNVNDNKPNPPLTFRLDKLRQEHPYLTEQCGLSLETIIDFGLGYFTGKRGMLAGHIVIPIHSVKGEIVAYAGHLPGESAGESAAVYKFPPGFKKLREVFNLDRAVKEPPDKPLVIVSDILDAIQIHQNGLRRVVALMNDQMSAAQEELIRQHTDPEGRVIVMLDENAGYIERRANVAARLSHHCFVRIQRFDKQAAQPQHPIVEEVRGPLPS